MLSRMKALQLLSKCRGDEIWSLETCKAEGVPESWIEELADTTESGFDNDLNSIYVEDKLVNHYHGVQDQKLAIKLGEFLGVDTSQVIHQAFGRIALVNAIKEAVEEL